MFNRYACGSCLTCCAILAAIGPGCRKVDQPEPGREATATKKSEQAAPSAEKKEGLDDFLATNDGAAALPPGHPPLSSTPPKAPAPAAQGPGSTLKYTAPATWQPEKPKSSMRKAQYVLPGIDGANGQMVVFYFGPGQGGPTQMNIDRWIGMFKKADGSPMGHDEARIENKTINGHTVTLVDVTGVYQDAMGGQSTPTAVDYRLYAAVVELPVGDKWFFKAVGPANTMATHRAGFDELLDSLE